MSNRNQDILFQLIKSMEKAEKRHFKLYIKRNSARTDLKVVQLFDAIDKLRTYDEKQLLSKLKGILKPQLANLKSHLYKQILASLRLLKSTDSIDLQLNEQFDYAHILYKKGLFHQSLKIIERTRELALKNQKFNFLIQLIALEKRIEGLHITRSTSCKAESLAKQSREISAHIEMVSKLSNLALLLYSWFIRYGHARNEQDEAGVRQFMEENLPPEAVLSNGFYERLYLYQSYTWYAYIRQDFLQYYRYTKKWTQLFEEEPLMVRVETGHYIKGLHNLLNAHFVLKNYSGFEDVLTRFEHLADTPRVKQHDNFRVQAFMYISMAKINRNFINGTFDEGVLLIPQIEKKLAEYSLFLDHHHILILNYKIALMYFGNGNYDKTIDQLQKIIHEPVDLGTDLHCYARLLHLLAHYELGNEILMEPLIKSVYRFMSRMENITIVEKEMFNFLRHAFHLPVKKLKPEFEKFHEKIKRLEKNRFETRSFSYLDIISWLEAKISGQTMSQVIRNKKKTSHRNSFILPSRPENKEALNITTT